MTKIEELRMDIVRSSRAINPHETVDCLIIALQHLMETRGKEALVAQGEAWAKECSRQVTSAAEMGRVEGARQMVQKVLAEAYPCRLSEKSHCWIYRIDDCVLETPMEQP